MLKHAKKTRRGLASLLISALLFSGVVLEATVSGQVEAAEASTCDFTITPVHGKKLYFNTKPNPSFEGAYLGYKIVAGSSNHAAVSVSVSLPSSNKTHLRLVSSATARPDSITRGLGNLDSGQAATAYFFAEVQGSPSANEAGVATVTIATSEGTQTCSFRETLVKASKSVLRANANKIFSARVSSDGIVGLGSRVIVTVTGNTGTLGSGPDATREINLVPVSVAKDWNPAAWTLEKVAYKSANPACNAGSVVVNMLFLTNTTTPKSTDCSGLYSANYTFLANPTFSAAEQASAEVQAFSYIASGNLIKHTNPFSTAIKLPVLRQDSSTVSSPAEPDLEQELNDAPIPFTLNDLNVQTNTTITVTSGEVSFFNASGGVNWTTFCIGADVSAETPSATCSETPVTISATTAQTGGVFSVAAVSDGTKRVTYNPNNAPRVTSDTVAAAEVGFRVADLDGNLAYGVASAEVSDIFLAQNLDLTALGIEPTESGTISGVNGTLESDRTCLIAGSTCVSQSPVVVSGVGTWELTSGNSKITFTALPGFSGSAAIDFRIETSGGTRAFGTANVVVVGQPSVTPRTGSTRATEDITLSPEVTAQGNFTRCIYLDEPAANPCTSTTQTAMSISWTLRPDGVVSFSAAAGFTGTTTVFYGVRDTYGQFASASMTVEVTNPPAPTVADITGVTTTTSPKSVTPVVTSNLQVIGCLEATSAPDSCASGEVVVAEVGSWTSSGGVVTFTAVAGFSGSATISYLVTDSLGQTGSATVTIIVTADGVSILLSVTHAASSVETTSATLNGSVFASPVVSNAYFCYDTQSNLATCTLQPATPTTVAADGSASVSIALTGLTAGTEYFFKVVAGDGTSTASGEVLSFDTQLAAAQVAIGSPTPEPIAPATSDPCVPEVALTSQETALLPYFAETFQVLVTGVAGSVGYGLDSLAANKLSLGLSLATVATSNPLLLSAGVLQGFGEGMLEISFNSRAQKQMQALTPEDVVLSPGTQMGDVELTTTDGQPLELLSIQSIDLNLYVDFSGAELNNPLLWQNLGYGLLCWKLEPFTETSFVLPNPIQLPANTPPGNWVYSNVIVKAGSATTDPTTFQANTLFPKPGLGQAVWADVNGNGIYDPGGKNGDKAISHIKICADLLVESDAPTPTPTPTTTSPVAPAPTATPTPTQTQVTPATPAPPLVPTSSSSATPAPTPSVDNCVSPAPTTSQATPFPTSPVDNPPIARPTPISPTMPPVVIRVEPLGIPTPTPTTPGATPAPTTPGVTPTPTPTTPGATPAPTVPGVTPTPGPETPGLIPNPQIDLSAPTECVPDSNFSVAMKVSNGLSTTCLRVTSVYFSQIAFMQRPLLTDENVVTTQEQEVLADTGAETSTLVLWALMLFGTGFVFLVLARTRRRV